jgi:hypothetical protein
MVEATLAQENLDELHVRLSGCFARVGPRRQARKYIVGLMSDLPRKNCWTMSEHAGDATPDRMQRLLNDAVWDTTAAMGTRTNPRRPGAALATRCVAPGASSKTRPARCGMARGAARLRPRLGRPSGTPPPAPRHVRRNTSYP